MHSPIWRLELKLHFPSIPLLFPAFWEEAQSIKHFTVYGLGCAHSCATEHGALSKNLKLRKKPSLNMGRTHRPLQLEMEVSQRRQNAGGKGLPNSKSLMLQWKTTSPFTMSSTTFQSSIFSRMVWCPSLASTAGKDGEGCGCHGDRWTWYAGVFTDGSDWSALQLFMAVTQHPWWVPTWHWPRCALPFTGKHSQRPEKFWFWLWFAPEPYDQWKYELSLGRVFEPFL